MAMFLQSYNKSVISQKKRGWKIFQPQVFFRPEEKRVILNSY